MRPMTVVLRVDRHSVLDVERVIEAIGFINVQVHEVQLPTSNVWRAWRVYQDVGPVDHVPPLTPAELSALDVQPGIVGVWLSR